MTDAQVLGHIYAGWNGASYPMNSINDMIQNFTPQTIMKGVDFLIIRLCLAVFILEIYISYLIH